MKKYARIDDGIVVELFNTDGDISTMFHPDFVWIEAGGSVKEGDLYQNGIFSRPPEAEPEPAPIPYAVTRRQGRLALIDVGKLQDVEAAISSITDPIERMKAQVEYEADTWDRDNIFLQSMWAALGGTESELDDLFVLAGTK